MIAGRFWKIGTIKIQLNGGRVRLSTGGFAKSRFDFCRGGYTRKSRKGGERKEIKYIYIISFCILMLYLAMGIKGSLDIVKEKSEERIVYNLAVLLVIVMWILMLFGVLTGRIVFQ